MSDPSSFGTPGVYIIEQDAFPTSVVEVPTAIPAFIGYTETASKDGKPITEPLLVSSLAEYQVLFGGPATVGCPIRRAGEASPPEGSVNIGGFAYSVEAPPRGHALCLYRCLELFFLNGGAPCYIVSIGRYRGSDGKRTAVRTDEFLAGLTQLSSVEFPRPTMILTPDALCLPKDDYYSVQQQALRQCGELKDRITLIEVYDGDQPLSSGVIDDFRTAIGTNSLSYGVTYYPFLHTTVVDVSDVGYDNVDASSEGAVALDAIFPDEPLLAKGTGALATLSADCNAVRELADPPPLDLSTPLPATLGPDLAGTKYRSWPEAVGAAPQSATAKVALQWRARTVLAMALVLGELRTNATVVGTGAKIGNASLIAAIEPIMTSGGELATVLAALVPYDQTYPEGALGVITSERVEAIFAGATIPDAKPYRSGDASAVARAALADAFEKFEAGLGEVLKVARTLRTQLDRSLQASNADYKALMTAVARHVNVLPPGPALAGVMTTVDNASGVWTAPANININSVVAPTVLLDDEQQVGLNVDPIGGKSVNAIRSFPGRGPAIIWGARTLDGNSEDWRYIQVRRTIIMLEQAMKNATLQFSFAASNDASTWASCKSMLESFLSGQWNQGALQGAKASDAYWVAVGVGTSMTEQDVLDGIMRVSVGVAVVHPAEFIVIAYEQQVAG